MAVEKRLDESLRDYIRRFNNETNTIPKLQQEIVVMALMNDRNNCEFKHYLTWKSLPTLVAAFNKAHDYIKSEELLKTSNRAMPIDKNQHPSDETTSGSNRSRAPSPVRGGGSRHEVKGAREPARYNNFTPLNTLRAAIYLVNQNREDWLKDNIEELIRIGYLTQYRLHSGGGQPPIPFRQIEYQQPEIRNDRQQGGMNQQGDGRQPPLSSGKNIVVDVITGGLVHEGTTSGARKSLSKHRHIVNPLDVDNRSRPSDIPSVTFTKGDARGIVFPRDDPLVLIFMINGAEIKRVLVDGGSFANILFMKAFDAMMIGRQYLTKVAYPVIGFNGSTVRQ
ncbi:uncharacterized protein LOC110730641 [Chenopodium quinoa]|uniref:uncharacterized protein LOC110730641 n=1 Tax=Chenopodium quinoa TaxID=63459 RepID=UPI000B78F0EB|nr:uncharacterized protein LOC110730641 [Chenopodium quinoa]